MTPPLSVLIPAHNEVRSIARTLESILSQEYPAEREIVVCANGCTDGTAEAVRRIAARAPVRLIVSPESGKANAWNRLFAAARHDRVAFCDADVRLRPGALLALAHRFSAPDSPLLVGGWHVPVSTGLDYLSRILAPPVPRHRSVCGRLYTAERPAILARMRERGCDRMPDAVIHDDVWLTLLVGPGAWAMEPSAVVEYRPPRWNEWLAIERRDVRGDRQLRAAFADLLAGPVDADLVLNEDRRRRWDRRAMRWRTARSPADRLAVVLNFLFKRVTRRLAEWQVSRESAPPPAGGFEFAPSTKRGPG